MINEKRKLSFSWFIIFQSSFSLLEVAQKHGERGTRQRYPVAQQWVGCEAE